LDNETPVSKDKKNGQNILNIWELTCTYNSLNIICGDSPCLLMQRFYTVLEYLIEIQHDKQNICVTTRMSV
jgi:hypothetical protein